MLSRIARLGRNEGGFTLIELLVVVAIVALLATFAAPKLFEAINKSKKAPGQADVQTISSALERYYMDLNGYPTGTAAAVKAAMSDGYLKSSTTYKNGFTHGYLYVTNATGSYYLFVDPRNNTGAVTVVCGVWNSGSITAASDLVVVTPASDPTSAQIATGCTLRAWVAGAPGGTDLDAAVVSN